MPHPWRVAWLIVMVGCAAPVIAETPRAPTSVVSEVVAVPGVEPVETTSAPAELPRATVCTAEIDRAPWPGTRVASWKALYDHLMREGTGQPGKLKHAKAIQRALCHDRNPPGDPLWDLCFYPTDGTNSNSTELVGPDAHGLVYYGTLGSALSGACQTSGVLSVTRVGALVHARYLAIERDWEARPDERRDPDCEPEDEDCDLECRDLWATVDDYVIDPATAQRLVRVRRRIDALPLPKDGVREDVAAAAIEAELAVRVEVGEAGVRLRGGGCDETIALLRGDRADHGDSASP